MMAQREKADRHAVDGGVTVAFLAVVLSVAALLDSFDIYRLLGFEFYTEQKLMLFFGLAMAISYCPKGRPRSFWRYSLSHWLPMLLSLAGTIYLSINYEFIYEHLFDGVSAALWGSVVLLLLLVEALRRAVGPPLAIFFLVILILGFFSSLLPEPLEGLAVTPSEYLLYLTFDSNALLGIPLAIVSTIVISFIFLGKLLEASNGTAFFNDISMAIMGPYRGGAAKISILASSFFGSVSGSAVANVVSSGIVTIPLMKRFGFAPQIAAAVESVASTGGQLMPPMMGAAAFVMAELLGVKFRDVAIAAIVPIGLYYLTLFIKTDLYAARHGIRGVDSRNLEPVARTFKDGWYFSLPFILIVIVLFFVQVQPQTAAIIAACATLPLGLLLGYKGQKMSLRAAASTLASCGQNVSMLLLISAMAGTIIGVLNITGLGFALTQLLVTFASGSIPQLLLGAALLSILLGMGMPTLGVYLLMAMLVVPALVQMGVNPISAHMFAMYYGMLSMITPPVCVVAFASAMLAETPPMRTGYSAMKFAWFAYLIPFLFVFSPELLLQGRPLDIVVGILVVVTGFIFISAAISGYLAGVLSQLSRLGYAAVGTVLLILQMATNDLILVRIVLLVLLALSGLWKICSGKTTR